MELSNLFWNASLEELKQGYIQDKDAFICLLCGEEVEKGLFILLKIIFTKSGRVVRVHIERTHKSVFEYLLGMDKKLTGLTDHQKSLLHLFFLGKNDKEIQKELDIGSTATIRHHRFALKEKERQAKTYLALIELLKEKDEHAPAFVPVHQTATMVDDRYNITKEEQEKIVSQYFSGGALTKFPPKEKQRLVILREISNQFKKDYMYEEKEINVFLQGIYKDYVLIRRYLIDYGFLDRKPDGSNYWVKK